MDNSEKHSAHINCTFNNTSVAIADNDKNIIFSTNAGELGFRGSKKSSIDAADQVASIVAHTAISYGIKSVDAYCRGSGIGREAAIKALLNAGLEINIIKDITPVPHNGCRPPQRRRI